MLLFGHIGITLGVALSGNQIYNSWLKSHVKPSKELESGTQSKPNPESVKGLFDIRFWLLGGILPDVIDKPIGHYLFSQAFGNNGRIFSHTLLFFILLLGAGLYIGIVKKECGYWLYLSVYLCTWCWIQCGRHLRPCFGRFLDIVSQGLKITIFCGVCFRNYLIIPQTIFPNS